MNKLLETTRSRWNHLAEIDVNSDAAKHTANTADGLSITLKVAHNVYGALCIIPCNAITTAINYNHVELSSFSVIYLNATWSKSSERVQLIGKITGRTLYLEWKTSHSSSRRNFNQRSQLRSLTFSSQFCTLDVLAIKPQINITTVKSN